MESAIRTTPHDSGFIGRLMLAAWGLVSYAVFIYVAQGTNGLLITLTAVAIGHVFLRSQFGFSYTWRVTITHRQTQGIRAQMLWVALTVIPFYWLTSGADGQAVANIRPLSMAVAVGALIFGIGMQLGGACTSGSIVGGGQGNSVPLFGIVGFIGGALWAAAQIEFWRALPALPGFSFYESWGMAGVGVMLLLPLAVIFICAKVPATQPLPPPPKDRMSLTTAACLLAVLTVVLLAVSGQPWGILNSMTLVGGKWLLLSGNEEITFWDFWSRFGDGGDVLDKNLLSHVQVLSTIGMALGVLLTAIALGQFRFSLASPKKVVLALAGGVAMGYGAQISFGCNIGSFISALSSGSLHGWLWFVFAFVGTGFGVLLRKILKLS